MTHRITPAEITARRQLLLHDKRSQDAAMVGQMQADIAKLREALAGVLTSYDRSNPMRTADMHQITCQCLRCARDQAQDALEATQ